MTPRATSTITFKAALALGTHFESASGRMPTPTTAQIRAMTMTSCQKRLMSAQKTVASVPAKRTNTDGAQ